MKSVPVRAELVEAPSFPSPQEGSASTSSARTDLEKTQVHHQLRPATAADAETLALIGAASFLDSYAEMIPGEAIVAHCAASHAPDAYRRLLAPDDAAAWLAETCPGGAPIGYALVTPPDLPGIAQGGDLELRRIYLLSRFHAAGVGRALMEHAIAHARARHAPRLLVGVYGGNDRAIAFYRRCGFTDAGTRRFTVGGETYDDLVLGLALHGMGKRAPPSGGEGDFGRVEPR